MSGLQEPSTRSRPTIERLAWVGRAVDPYVRDWWQVRNGHLDAELRRRWLVPQSESNHSA